MAHGRSLSWAIPVHAILSVEQTKKAPADCHLGDLTAVLAF